MHVVMEICGRIAVLDYAVKIAKARRRTCDRIQKSSKLALAQSTCIQPPAGALNSPYLAENPSRQIFIKIFVEYLISFVTFPHSQKSGFF